MDLENTLSNVQSCFDDIEAGCRYYLTLLARATGYDVFDPEYHDYVYLPFENEVNGVEYYINDLINNATSMDDDCDVHYALECLEQTLNDLKRAVTIEKRNNVVTANACVDILDSINAMLDHVQASISDLEDEFKDEYGLKDDDAEF